MQVTSQTLHKAARPPILPLDERRSFTTARPQPQPETPGLSREQLQKIVIDLLG